MGTWWPPARTSSAARPSPTCAPDEGRLRATWSGEPFGEGHRQRIVAVTAQTPGGAVTVYAGTSLRDADAADEITKVALGIGTPLLLATVALVTWWVTGRALRPVEAIRSEVAEITGRVARTAASRYRPLRTKSPASPAP